MGSVWVSTASVIFCEKTFSVVLEMFCQLNFHNLISDGFQVMSGEDDRKRRKRRFGENYDDKGSSGSGSGSAGAAPMKDDDDTDTDDKAPTKDTEDPSEPPTKKLTRDEDIKLRMGLIEEKANDTANLFKQEMEQNGTAPFSTEDELLLLRMVYESTSMGYDMSWMVATYSEKVENRLVTEDEFTFHHANLELGMGFGGIRVVSFDQKTGSVGIQFIQGYVDASVEDRFRYTWNSVKIQPATPDIKTHYDDYTISQQREIGLTHPNENSVFLMRNDQLMRVEPKRNAVVLLHLLEFKKPTTLKRLRVDESDVEVGMSEDGLFMWTKNDFYGAGFPGTYAIVFNQTGKQLILWQDTDDYMVVGVIPGTRQLVVLRYSGSVGISVYDVDTGILIKRLNIKADIANKVASIYRSDDYRLTKNGIWSIKHRLYHGAPPLTVDQSETPHLDFIEFPKGNETTINTIHTTPLRTGISRLYLFEDSNSASVGVLHIDEQTNDINVFVVHPRSVLHNV